MTSPPLWQGIAFVAIGLAPIAVIVFAVVNGRLGRLDGASYLVLWGLLIAVGEHVGFGQSEFGGFRLRTHEGFHLQMLAAYGLGAFALIGAVIAPLIRRGDKLGWYGLLTITVLGLGAESLTAAITTPHGVAPRWWSWGLVLWAYPIAWIAALALARRPVFEAPST